MICVEVVRSDDNSIKFYYDQTTDTKACKAVLMSGEEANAYSVFSLSPAQGLELSAAAAFIFAVAFVFKMIRRTINLGDSHVEND